VTLLLTPKAKAPKCKPLKLDVDVLDSLNVGTEKPNVGGKVMDVDVKVIAPKRRFLM
jgi:hypothetical protein